MVLRSISEILPSGARIVAGAIVMLTLAVASCGSTRPTMPTGPGQRAWLVKPHQREYLADRIMRPDADAQERAADHHIMVTREGTIGGGGTVGGGCGCN